jgi:hypothetical protein
MEMSNYGLRCYVARRPRQLSFKIIYIRKRKLFINTPFKKLSDSVTLSHNFSAMQLEQIFPLDIFVPQLQNRKKSEIFLKIFHEDSLSYRMMEKNVFQY